MLKLYMMSAVYLKKQRSNFPYVDSEIANSRYRWYRKSFLCTLKKYNIRYLNAQYRYMYVITCEPIHKNEDFCYFAHLKKAFGCLMV